MLYRALLVYNPQAGPWDMTRALKRLTGQLGEGDWQTELVQTHSPGDATRHTQRAAAAGYDLALIAGGDGTVNEAVNGLAGSGTALGILPVGTGNILAHQLHMPVLSLVAPLYLRDVANALTRGRIQRVDVGRANQRSFLCWAGLGLDAEVAAQLEPRPRYIKRLRTLPYMLAGISVATEYRGVPSRITMDETTQRTRTYMAVASNIQLYAAFFHIAPQAQMDDGLLDLFVFKGLGFSYALRYLLLSVGGRHLQSPDVIHHAGRSMSVETYPPVAVHLDGEPCGQTPARIDVWAGALRLLVPPQAPKSLFGKPPEPR